MEIRAFPADALILATGGCGLIFGRSTNSMACNGSAASRAFQAGARYANGEFIQVHPTAIPGADKLRLISESARGEGGPHLGAAQAARSRARRRRFPRASGTISSKSAIRSTATWCRATSPPARSSRSASRRAERPGRPDVRLSRRDPPAPRPAGPQAGRHPGNLREVPGRRSAHDADEDFSRRPLLDGRAVVRLRSQRRGRPARRLAAQPADQHARALRHRRVRLSVPRRQPPGGQFAGGLHLQRPDRGPGRDRLHRQPRPAARRPISPPSLFDRAAAKHQADYKALLARPGRRPESLPHPRRAGPGDDQDRHGRPPQRRTRRRLREGLRDWKQRAHACSLADTGEWANQNVVFAAGAAGHVSAGQDDRQGGLARDECRGAHYKPEFAMPDIDGHRAGRAPPAGRGVVPAVRGEQPQVAEDDRRHACARRRAAVELRGRRHVADPPAAAALRRGGRRSDRRSLERTSSSRECRSAGKHHRAANMPDASIAVTSHRHDIHGPRPAAGRAGPEELLAAVPRRVRARHELHQRVAEDRREPRDGRGPAGVAGGLGVQLPGRGLRRLHDAGQRPRAPGLHGAGGRSCSPIGRARSSCGR